ncbi:hypothetical protein, partial [Rehaibacterium terrae]
RASPTRVGKSRVSEYGPGGSPALAHSARALGGARTGGSQTRRLAHHGGILHYVLRQLASAKAA